MPRLTEVRRRLARGDELMAYAREGDVVVVTELSRRGRSVRHLVVLVDELREAGIGVRATTQGIDTTAGPTGTLLLSLFAALAEIERTILVERTRDGLATARSQGRVGGRPTVVGPERLRHARALLVDGTRSVTEVARSLGVRRGALYRALERDGYQLAKRSARQRVATLS